MLRGITCLVALLGGIACHNRANPPNFSTGMHFPYRRMECISAGWLPYSLLSKLLNFSSHFNIFNIFNHFILEIAYKMLP